MITTLIFDLNGTIVKQKFGPKDDVEFKKVFGFTEHELWYASREFQTDYVIGKIHLRKFLLLTIKKLGIDKKLLNTMLKMHEDSFYAVNGMKPLLLKLKKDYRMVLLAGDGRESVKFKIDNFGYRECFHKIYSTHIEHTHKEDVRIYRSLLKKEDINPGQCLFIDDSARHVACARDVGINAIHFKDIKTLRDDLKQFKI